MLCMIIPVLIILSSSYANGCFQRPEISLTFKGYTLREQINMQSIYIPGTLLWISLELLMPW